MPVPRSARKHYAWSAALAERATRKARAQRRAGTGAVAGVVVAHQLAAARKAEPATAEMLTEQAIDQAADALLNSLAFVTLPEQVEAMLEQVDVDHEFDRLVASLVADAGRAAMQVATAARPRVGFVRYLSPPSCSRCAVLAGRIYRYSDGFLRHPGCDCTMVPTSLANPAFVHDPVDLARRGLVTGLSKADQRAIAEGADMGQVVNVRQRAAGLTVSGRVLARRGRPTPEGIYGAATSREDALDRLAKAGYIT